MAARRGFAINNANDFRRQDIDRTGAIGFNQDFESLLEQRTAQLRCIFLKQRFAAGNFHQRRS